MSSGLYSGVSGLALGTGLYKGVSGLWGGASGLITGGGVALSLDFLVGNTLDPRVTFTRTSNATLVDNTGRVTYAPNNLLLRSQEFDVTWAATNSTVVPTSVTTAPDGTFTAYKHIPNEFDADGVTRTIMGIGAGDTRIFQNVTAIIGANYVYSMYAKAGEFDQIQFALIATPSVTATFSLTLGTVISGSGSNISITPVGDGWYRCSFTTTSGVNGALAVRWSAKDSTIVNGDGVSGIYVWGSQIEAITYQTLPSTYVKTVASTYNGPRFDYNPFSLAPLGLLIEEQRANLLLRSEDFSTSWTLVGSSVNSNIAISPSGTTTADKVIPDNGVDLTVTGEGAVRQSPTYTANATLTFSVFAKEAEFDQIQLFFSEGTGTSNRAQVTYSLVDGSVVTAAAVVGTFTNPSSTATPVGNGWYRFTLTFTTGSGTSGRARFCARDSGTTTGDGTSGILLWGAQVEAGAFVTSYIPTGSATATRAPDIATMTGTNFSSWYNASEGTFVSSFEASPNPYTTYVAASNGVVAQNSIHMDNDIGGTMRVPYYSGSAPSAILSLGAIGTLGAINTLSTAYKVNDFAASRNGAAVVTDPAGAVPVGVVQLNIGADPSGVAVNVSNTHIRNITYYNSRVTDAQLQELSAPLLGPSLNLDFLTGTLDSRVTFTRSTTGTFVGSDGLIQTAAINVPRFDYDPTTLALKGLLIEEQRANLATYSQEPSDAAWNKTRSSITADVMTAPDGTLTGDKLVEDTSENNTHRTSVPAISMTSGTYYTFSIFLKAGERTSAFIAMHTANGGNAFTTRPSFSVNLLTGAITGATATVTASSAVSFPDGWWRVSISGLATLTTTNSPTVFMQNATNATSYTGDGTSGLFLWGGQVEAAPYATSYIPTVASTVTRDPDTAAMTGANFTSWYNYNEGSIAVTASSFRRTAGSARNFQFDNGTNDYLIGTFGDILLSLNDDAVPFYIDITPTPPVPLDGTVYKFASAWKANDFASVTTGAVETNTGAPIPANISQLLLGSGTGGGYLNGHLRNIVYYSTRLTNTQLRALWT